MVKTLLAATMLFVASALGAPGETGHVVEATPAPTATPSGGPGAAAAAAPPACLTDADAANDLRRRYAEIDEQRKAVEKRELELRAKEAAVEAELAKLKALRDEIAKVEDKAIQENTEKVVRLVEAFQAMSPKSAAAVIAKIDTRLAVAALTRMDTPKLAKIMAALPPERSGHLTEWMAGVPRAKAESASIEGAAGDKKQKGGE